MKVVTREQTFFRNFEFADYVLNVKCRNGNYEFMTSKLDYCYVLLCGCSTCLITKSSWSKMQQQEFSLEPGFMTISARFCQHNTGSLLKQCIDFKSLLISTYKALNGLAPQYMSKLLLYYSPPRPLHSQNSGYLIIPRISKSTEGGRPFSYLAPKLWNNLTLFRRQTHSVILNLDQGTISLRWLTHNIHISVRQIR